MAYTKITWKDFPSTDTPVNAENLNKMDQGIYDNDAAIEDLTDVVNQSRIIKIIAGGQRGYDNAYYLVQKAVEAGNYLVSVENVNEAKFLIETVAKQVLTGETVEEVENVTQAVFNTYLKQRITALETAMKTYYYKTIDTSKGTQIKLRRYGKMVTFRHHANMTISSTTTSTSIASIPSGYRPADNISFSNVLVSQSRVIGAASWTLNTNGALSINTDVNGLAEYHIAATYMTNDAYPESDAVIPS